MLDAIELEPFVRLDKDLKKAATTLTPDEARYLVDAYYQIQGYRIRFGNQIRALSESGEPHDLIRWMYSNTEGLEKNIQSALDKYSKSNVVGKWARSIIGIGPVLAAGLLAHIDITKAPTVGHIWSFAGLNPNASWEKGQKRPWNAELKVICWKIGESFVKVQNNERDVYGKLYVARKAQEQERNAAGAFAEQAALLVKKVGKETEAYKAYSQGKLPPAHINERAKRYAVKMFLSHLHWVWYETEYGTLPPKPFVIEHMGHTDLLKPPNWPMEED